MPNIKSAEKRVKVTEAKTLQNKRVKTALRTSVKKCKEAIANKDVNAVELLKETISSLDSSVNKTILHKNTAARKKSRLAKAFNLANAAK